MTRTIYQAVTHSYKVLVRAEGGATLIYMEGLIEPIVVRDGDGLALELEALNAFMNVPLKVDVKRLTDHKFIEEDVT